MVKRNAAGSDLPSQLFLCATLWFCLVKIPELKLLLCSRVCIG